MALNESGPKSAPKLQRGRKPRGLEVARAASRIAEASELRALESAMRAAAAGDFTVRLPAADRKSPIRELVVAFNRWVERSALFEREIVRVERAVGRDGRLGERVSLGADASGGWATSAGAINALIGDLMRPTIEVARVLGAVAAGDLSHKLALEIDGKPVKGEFARICSTVNSMVDQLSVFAAEVTRVAKEVGTEGKLGGQAVVPNAAGLWRDLTDNVNQLANNLTSQVRNIADVTTAVANGDLSKKITVDARGEVLELKDTVNTMVDQLNSFASEVTRVAKEVGTEGKLGGQADVKGVSGVWKDLTDNVNFMASNLTTQVRGIVKVVTAVANGDLSQRLEVNAKGEIAALADTLNSMTKTLGIFAEQVTSVARTVGVEGKLGAQADVPGVAGTWKDLTENVNGLANNLTAQVRNIAEVTTAVANGDLSRKISVDARGEVNELKNTINTMVDQLRSFASEVTRVAKEVGTEGKLGGQAQVPGVSGTWKGLTDNVNSMASNLTTQVRGIVKVVTAVANGDLSQKLVGVEAKGEIAALADTINNMCDTLGTFADQVSTVASEVGIEGRLGGQAKVPGATGTWRQLTDNVNQLAANLTGQVRAISEVATAVTKGDLTRSIDVQAEGEVALLKDNINQMIRNLRETTQKNTEQDWLKTNLAKFSSMMQGQKNLQTVSEMIMSELTPLVSAHHGAFFMTDTEGGAPTLALMSTYAYRERKGVANRFRMGEGLVGQCAREKKPILLTRVPSDYIHITSGLGEAPPLNIIVLPVLFEGEVKAVIELAGFHPFSAIHQLFLDQLTVSIGVVLNMITANMRTEQLLLQSQGLTQELQSQSKELQVQQQELRRTNLALEKQALELEEKARLLAEQNEKVEIKNREVEQARRSLEEKAEQLALASKYKSEFFANMSHELRTPLNSLLILARLLADNSQSNLSAEQVDYARTIYASGTDLLALINEILDLSKVEAGRMQVDPRSVLLVDLMQSMRRSFQPVAHQKGLTLTTLIAPGAPEAILTDPQRLQQVLKNLLSNAFKFTETGSVTLRIHAGVDRSRLTHDALRRAPRILGFEVADTGIGIPQDKQRLIFEAFQQADGTTSRRYGGTGLGLSISREIGVLLGGEIQVTSAVGRGSVFTLYLPESYAAREPAPDAAALAARAAPAGADALLSLTPRPIQGDRVDIRPGDRVLLVIEDAGLGARKVLVVDDDVRNIFALSSALEARGHQVVYAEDGRAGIDALQRDPGIDAVLMDVTMPRIDGYQAIRAIRANPMHSALPIVALAAKALAEDRERCIGAGATDCLAKPVDPDELLERIARWTRPAAGAGVA